MGIFDQKIIEVAIRYRVFWVTAILGNDQFINDHFWVPGIVGNGHLKWLILLFFDTYFDK